MDPRCDHRESGGADPDEGLRGVVDQSDFRPRHSIVAIVASAVGLGGAVAALMLVPIVNLFGLGIGAAGATLASIDLAGEGERRTGERTH